VRADQDRNHGGGERTTLGNLTYTYDAGSQRTKVSGTWARSLIPNAVASATYDAANQQTAFGGQTQTFDLNGNLTGDGTNTYTWNVRNQLASIAGPTPASFVYDPLGRRQRKTINGTITDFVYDGLNPVKEATGATTVNLLTGLGIDEYLTRTTGSGTEYFLSEALGSTVALADGSGAVATEYSYEPFGTATASGTSSGNELGYTAREDDGAGVYYYRARYYHPGLQRFISEDPIDWAGGDTNLYAYVTSDPVNMVDPLGLVLDVSALPSSCQTGQSRSKSEDGPTGIAKFLGGLWGRIDCALFIMPGPAALEGPGLAIVRGFRYDHHGLMQIINRGVRPYEIADALRTPQRIVEGYGRVQRFVGRWAEVRIDQTSGQVETVIRFKPPAAP
jgi:RHS repeat-associated protein